MNQNASEAVRVAAVKDITEERPFCVKAGDKALALFKTKTGYAAIDNLCPHIGGPLCEGTAKDGTVACPWHGSRFNVETGAVVNGPATMPVATYPVLVRGEDIFVQL